VTSESFLQTRDFSICLGKLVELCEHAKKPEKQLLFMMHFSLDLTY